LEGARNGRNNPPLTTVAKRITIGKDHNSQTPKQTGIAYTKAVILCLAYEA